MAGLWLCTEADASIKVSSSKADAFFISCPRLSWLNSGVRAGRKSLRIDSGDAVPLDHLLIEDDSESRRVFDRRHAVFYGGAIEPHLLPDRVALGIGKAFDIGAVRHRGQQVLRDLRFFVVRHPHAGGVSTAPPRVAIR